MIRGRRPHKEAAAARRAWLAGRPPSRGVASPRAAARRFHRARSRRAPSAQARCPRRSRPRRAPAEDPRRSPSQALPKRPARADENLARLADFVRCLARGAEQVNLVFPEESPALAERDRLGQAFLPE
ncbi:hypothetical protein [Sorangium sp. So ce1000]|uniref:hypothetical protein n=1 Tax=Sorangium sp. So ce1000 TaxID=3133325 RepID=UPI003F5DEBE3